MKKLISIIAIILFIFLGVYSYSNYYKYYPSINDLLTNRLNYENKLISLAGSMKDKTNSSFYLVKGGDRIEVLFEKPEYPKYGYVSVLGYYKDGKIEAVSIHNHDYNHLKYVVSIIGFIIFIFFFFREWIITRRGLKCRIG